jgi:hypothetical protein
VVAEGEDAHVVAMSIVDQLAAPDLRLAIVFADWRLDPSTMARTLARVGAPVVGCTATSFVARGAPANGAVALGLYGDWLRAGVGIAPELSKSALTRSRDALTSACEMLGTTPAALDPARHVALTMFDGRTGHEEAFCIGSAAAAPQIRVVGGAAGIDLESNQRPHVWCNGELLGDAGVVVVLDSALPFQVVTSSHLVATATRTVVTAAAGRVIEQLDGMPAAQRLRELVLTDSFDARPSEIAFARIIDGMPYVRTMTRVDGDRIHLATAVESGHVLRVMRGGDLVGTTRRDLATAAERLDGTIAAFIAFSCLARHWEASLRGLEGALDEAYAAYPTTGFHSLGEQSGMLFVNHTLTGLAIGEVPR